MLQAKRVLGARSVIALLTCVVALGCGRSGESQGEPGRSMAQTRVEKPPPPRPIESGAQAKQSTRTTPTRQTNPEVDFVATEPDGRAFVGEPIRLHVERAGQVVWAFEVEIDWRLNGVLIEGEHDDVLETGSFAPGDVVVGRARANASGRASRRVSSEPVQLVHPAPPTILSEATIEFVDGEFRYRLKAESPVAGAVLEYRLVTGPDGMSVDSETGLATWRLAESQEGRFEIDIAVLDPWGGGAAQNFEINVASSQPPASPASAR